MTQKISESYTSEGVIPIERPVYPELPPDTSLENEISTFRSMNPNANMKASDHHRFEDVTTAGRFDLSSTQREKLGKHAIRIL